MGIVLLPNLRIDLRCKQWTAKLRPWDTFRGLRGGKRSPMVSRGALRAGVLLFEAIESKDGTPPRAAINREARRRNGHRVPKSIHPRPNAEARKRVLWHLAACGFDRGRQATPPRSRPCSATT